MKKIILTAILLLMISVAGAANCTDTDGGINYGVKGSATALNPGIEGRIDCCKGETTTYFGDPVNHIGPGGGPCLAEARYLYESFCAADTDVPQMMVYECPGICRDGACVSASGQPDLTVISVSWKPNPARLGSKMSELLVTIKNLGSSNAELPGVKVRINKDNAYFYELGATSPLYNLAPGEQKIVNLTSTLPNIPVFAGGNYLLQATVDADSRIAESDENNNAKSVAFAVPYTYECTDTDGGMAYEVKGTVSGVTDGFDHPDFCILNPTIQSGVIISDMGKMVSSCSGSNCYLIETFCPQDYWSNTQRMIHTGYACPNGCSNGACVSIVQQSCTETDGGKNPAVYGTVESYVRSSTTGQLELVRSYDTCVGSGGTAMTNVIEYYCKDDGLGGRIVNSESSPCAYGCSNGACQSSSQDSCSDTDGGENIRLKGLVAGFLNGQSYTYYDSCMLANSVPSIQGQYTSGATGVTECSGNRCYLSEQVCTGTLSNPYMRAGSRDIPCTTGCRDGACMDLAEKGDLMIKEAKAEIKDQKLILSIRVKNIGTGDAVSDLTRQYKMIGIWGKVNGKDMGWTTSETYPDGIYLKPGEEKLITWDYGLNNLVQGQNTVKLTVDRTYDDSAVHHLPNGYIDESNEANNEYSTSLYYDKAVNWPRISDISGEKSSYFTKEPISLVIKAVEADGTPAESGEGFNIQFYTYELSNPAEPLQVYMTSGHYNAYYDQGYWHVDYYAPTHEGSYYTEIALYCSLQGSKCFDSYPGFDERQKIYFTVSKGCSSDSECQASFSHCSCSWTCSRASDVPKVDCARACPDSDYESEKPSCSCIDGNCVSGNCEPKCLNDGTRSEGWYDSCSRRLIRYEDCSQDACPIGKYQCDSTGFYIQKCDPAKGWYNAEYCDSGCKQGGCSIEPACGNNACEAGEASILPIVGTCPGDCVSLQDVLILKDISPYAFTRASSKTQDDPNFGPITVYEAGYSYSGRDLFAYVFDLPSGAEAEDVFESNLIGGSYYIETLRGSRIYMVNNKEYVAWISGDKLIWIRTFNMNQYQDAKPGGAITGNVVGDIVARQLTRVEKLSRIRETLAATEPIQAIRYYPKEVVIAYLEKYPSTYSGGTICGNSACEEGEMESCPDDCVKECPAYDIDPGLEAGCIAKGGRYVAGELSSGCPVPPYCIDEEFGDAEKLAVLMKLEALRIKVQELKEAAESLSEYYDSKGQFGKSVLWEEVAENFGEVLDRIDEFTAQVDDATPSEAKELSKEFIRQVKALLKESVNSLIQST
jgi:hypothetical protein